MSNEPGAIGLLGLLPWLVISIGFGLLVNRLAKDKGRDVRKWTILGFIPGVNVFLMWYFVGASNLRVESKIDKILAHMESSKGSGGA